MEASNEEMEGGEEVILKAHFLHHMSSNAELQESFGSPADQVSTKSHDQLVTRGQKVTWYQGLDPATRTIRKVYSVDSPILQAFWCRFPEEGGGVRECGCVGVREQGCLGIYMDSGVVHFVPFPFPVKWVWPLDCGVLVERQLAADSAYDGLPTLFSLLHPLDDICPVTCHRYSATASDVKVVGFFGEPGLEVVDVCCVEESAPLVLSYSSPSRQHHIWALQHATREDIPAHLTTPQRPQTPVKPLSTSDPSCYGNDATPMAGMMNTPVEMILNSQQHGASTVKRKPSLLTQHHDVYVCGSGRSPFISRLQTPSHGPLLAKCSKSLSPPTVARMSPFSQTVDSHSWSTFYSEELSFGLTFEPLLPQHCLHLLWTSCPSEEPAKAVSLFSTSDLTGCGYVGVVLPSSNQLWLIPDDVMKGDSPTWGGVVDCVAGTHAVSLAGQGVWLVLDPQQRLLLYSGPRKVCGVDVESVGRGLGLQGGVAAVSVSHPVGGDFTVAFEDGVKVRCALPPQPLHPITELCLCALKQVLPHQLALELQSCYASLSWASSPLPPHLSHFLHWLGVCLGSPHPHTGMEDDVVMGVGPQTLQQIPALKLLLANPPPKPPPAVAPPLPETAVAMETVSLGPYGKTALLAIHLVYEELKVSRVESGGVKELAVFLLHATSWFGWELYVDHYCRDFPLLFHHTPSPLPATEQMEEDTPTFLPPSSPPHLHQWLLMKLAGSEPAAFPVLPAVCSTTLRLIKLYSLLTCTNESFHLPSLMVSLSDAPLDSNWAATDRLNLPPKERVLLQMVDEGMTRLDLDSLPVGVALPLLDCIRCCREAPPTRVPLPLAAYHLIGRLDIARTLGCITDTLNLPYLEGSTDNDGIDLDLEVLKLRFPKDLRAREVRRMLQSADPVRISLVQEPEVSDHEFIQQQETRLLAISQRTMALPVGRGMFTLSTVHPLPTSPLFIPPLNLSGRVPPRNSAVGLDHVDKPADMTQWAEFHNGVAAGLRLASSSSKLDASWIVFNRPSKQDSANTYAGFLMALGLSGHLASLQDYDLYGYLQDKHELTVVGLLLGVAASKYICVCVCVHAFLPFRGPPRNRTKPHPLVLF